MRLAAIALFAAAVVCVASPASAEMRLTIADGRVTLAATDVTLGQILAEWGRVGQTRVVNGDRISGGLMTIELTDMPEADALEILLRPAGGYVLAPRRTPAPTASVYDRIVIFAVSSLPRPAVSAPAAAAMPTSPTFPQPRLGAPRLPEGPANDATEAQAGEPATPPVRGGAIFTAMPPANNNAAPPPAAPPQPVGFGSFSAPAGTRFPGMTVPAPATTNGQPQNGATSPR